MRLGIVLDTADRARPLDGLVRQARAAEALGIEAAWLEDAECSGPPLITAAALAARTRVLRLTAGLPGAARMRTIARIASFVRPRVIQVPLPAGLEAYWKADLEVQPRGL